jgi:hypothetical protein
MSMAGSKWGSNETLLLDNWWEGIYGFLNKAWSSDAFKRRFVPVCAFIPMCR